MVFLAFICTLCCWEFKVNPPTPGWRIPLAFWFVYTSLPHHGEKSITNIRFDKIFSLLVWRMLTLLDNLYFTLYYNNIMCKISDNTTIFSTSHWEKKIQSFYLGWELLSNNSQIQNVHQTSGWRFFGLRQTVICQGTYLILAIPLLKWLLVIILFTS